jgi:hypothetical protein
MEMGVAAREEAEDRLEARDLLGYGTNQLVDAIVESGHTGHRAPD